MEVQKEAQRIMTMSVWKMYHSRMQRGGLRLHRSLQLSLVMRNARDLYLSAKLDEEEEEEQEGDGMGANPAAAGQVEGKEEAAVAHQEARTPSDANAEPEPMETQEEEPMETQEEEPEGGGGGGGGGETPPPSPWSPLPRSSPRPSRKRRSSSLGKMGASDDAGLVPSKKARLEEEEEEEEEEGRPPQGQEEEGPFPGLARVLQDRFSGLIPETTTTPPSPEEQQQQPKGGSCRQQGEGGVLSILVRAVVAF